MQIIPDQGIRVLSCDCPRVDGEELQVALLEAFNDAKQGGTGFYALNQLGAHLHKDIIHNACQ